MGCARWMSGPATGSVPKKKRLASARNASPWRILLHEPTIELYGVPREQRAAHRSLPAHDDAGLSRCRHGGGRGVRILHAQAAPRARLPDGGGTRTGAGIPRGTAFLIGRAGMAPRAPPRHSPVFFHT